MVAVSAGDSGVKLSFVPADRGPGVGLRRRRDRRWPLVVIASAHLMAVLDTTVMFVALPSLQRGLGMSVTSRQWVVTAYTLALAGFLLTGGRLADRFGARRTLLVGVAGFACAFGMMLILTYQLQSIMGYSALQTGLALVPFALAGVDQRCPARPPADGPHPAGMVDH